MSQRPCQRGVSLIEVLVAMLVFSAGLIGAGGMLATSVRATHSAYLRSQAVLLAQGMADRMQANPIGVWSGAYNGSYPGAGSQDCAAGCMPGQLAVYDKRRWSDELARFLPAGVRASVACRSEGLAFLPAPDQLGLRPPYGGSCRMRIDWIEQGLGSARAIRPYARQTFAWEFQP